MNEKEIKLEARLIALEYPGADGLPRRTKWALFAVPPCLALLQRSGNDPALMPALAVSVVIDAGGRQ